MPIKENKENNSRDMFLDIYQFLEQLINMCDVNKIWQMTVRKLAAAAAIVQLFCSTSLPLPSTR